MFYREASGRDLFALAYDAENTETLQIAVGGQIIELCFVYVAWYDEPREKATYVVVKVPDEESLDVGQIVRMSDGSTAFTPDVDDNIKLMVFNEFKRRINGVSENEEAPPKPDATTAVHCRSNKESSKKGKKTTLLPKLSWYAYNGVPIEQIPIDKKILKKSLSEEERTMVAVTTYPLVVRNSFIVLGLLALAAMIVVIAFVTMQQELESAFVLMAVFVVGSFIVKRFSGVFDGFEEISGTWRIKMPIGYHILYRLIAPIAMLWSAIALMIFKMLGKNERFKMLMMPRVGMPKGCGFDDIISVYKKYEAEVDKMDAIAIKAGKNTQQHNALVQKTEQTTESAKRVKAELEQTLKKDFSTQTYAQIQKLDTQTDKLKKAQADYEKTYREADAILKEKLDSMIRAHNDDVNDL